MAKKDTLKALINRDVREEVANMLVAKFNTLSAISAAGESALVELGLSDEEREQRSKGFRHHFGYCRSGWPCRGNRICHQRSRVGLCRFFVERSCPCALSGNGRFCHLRTE